MAPSLAPQGASGKRRLPQPQNLRSWHPKKGYFRAYPEPPLAASTSRWPGDDPSEIFPGTTLTGGSPDPAGRDGGHL